MKQVFLRVVKGFAFIIQVAIFSVLVILIGTAWLSAASVSEDRRQIHVSPAAGEDEAIKRLLYETGRFNAAFMVYAAECGYSDGSALDAMSAALSGRRASDPTAGIFYVRRGWDSGAIEIYAANLVCNEELLHAFRLEAMDRLEQMQVLMQTLEVNQDA